MSSDRRAGEGPVGAFSKLSATIIRNLCRLIFFSHSHSLLLPQGPSAEPGIVLTSAPCFSLALVDASWDKSFDKCTLWSGNREHYTGPFGWGSQGKEVRGIHPFPLLWILILDPRDIFYVNVCWIYVWNNIYCNSRSIRGRRINISICSKTKTIFISTPRLYVSASIAIFVLLRCNVYWNFSVLEAIIIIK